MKRAAGTPIVSIGAISIAAGLLATSAMATPRPLGDREMGQVVAGDNFTVINEVSDTAGGAPNVDPQLKNPWGLSQGPGTFLWSSDNNSGVSTLYDSTGNLLHAGPFAKAGLTVQILDGAADQGAIASPTGTVFTDGTTATFNVTGLNAMGVSTTSHAFFLFDTEDGTIQGWAPGVNFGKTEIAVDLSGTNASFKGLALLDNTAQVMASDRDPQADLTQAIQQTRLYAADFQNNRVDVFDSNFQQVGSFTDKDLPSGFAPFNVQTLNGKIYVTFAKFDPATTEGLPGAGLGIVDVFDPGTHDLHRLITGGALNAPWGLDIAPAGFGQFAGDLLVGNFGDGKVNAYDPNTGHFVGTLTTTAAGNPAFQETDLWTIRNGSDGSVIFSAGLTNQANGLIGVIKPAWAAASWAYQSHVQLGR
jgi:uncharacterized protein (TIGR03118 family)